MRQRLRYLVVLGALLGAACNAPDWGASAILHPSRRPLAPERGHPVRRQQNQGVPDYESVTFNSQGLRLEGWLFRTSAHRCGLIVYLHGIADNRRAGLGLAQRFLPRGYDVFAYDARAHGRSQGDTCTYGYFERHDVSRALDALGAQRAILFGSSLGAAVALQAAAIDARVTAVVAQSPFSDLPSIVRFRAPWYLPDRFVGAALARAGEHGGFPPSEASPLACAPRIRVPVLLVHGAADHETPPEHSRRIYTALAGPRRLLLVPGAGHNDVLAREDVWREIERWLDSP
jgi:uncharacterized protein